MTLQTILPMGEEALLIRMPDESSAVRLVELIRHASPPWLRTAYPAYATVGLFFDAELSSFEGVAKECRYLWDRRSESDQAFSPPRLFQIPVCYELGADHAAIAACLKLPIDSILAGHVGTVYSIHAIGFVPGFPYMGYLPDNLSGVPRLASPRLQVEPGSVGIVGRQTGIYPSACPGGWHLLGRTPLTIVDAADRFFPLAVGDQVQFERIDEKRFRELLGERIQHTLNGS